MRPKGEPVSDAKPFAQIDEDSGIMRIVGRDVSFGVGRSDIDAINAEHESRCADRERAAAAKALRDTAKAWRGYGSTYMERHNRVTDWLHARADAVERPQ